MTLKELLDRDPEWGEDYPSPGLVVFGVGSLTRLRGLDTVEVWHIQSP